MANMTTKEALVAIKRAPAGTKFCLRWRGDAPVAGKDGLCFPKALSGYVVLGRKEALRIVDECLSERMEELGARIPVELAREICWIG